MKRFQSGFTLIELLVVVSIIALLVTILLPSLGKARALAREAQAASNMHQMMIAYAQYTSDNDGRLLPGFLPDSVAWSVQDSQYNLTIAGHAAARYPWRLLPYTRDWRLLFGGSPISPDAVNTYSYQLSLLPRFGLNSAYVGGDHQFNGFDAAGRSNAAGPAIFRITDATRPADLIVFAETGCYSGGKPFAFPAGTLPPECPAADLQQYFQLQPPAFGGTDLWHVQAGQLVFTSNDIMGVPQSFSGGRPVAGFLDGHAQAMKLKEFDDPRLWAGKTITP